MDMDIHAKSVDMDMDMDGKFHIHGKPANPTCLSVSRSVGLSVCPEGVPWQCRD